MAAAPTWQQSRGFVIGSLAGWREKADTLRQRERATEEKRKEVNHAQS